MARHPVEVGDYFANQNGWVRRIVSNKDDLCQYREYLPGSDCAFKSGCLDRSIKKWGKRITAEHARQLVPNMDEMDRVTDQRDREMAAIIIDAVLKAFGG